MINNSELKFHLSIIPTELLRNLDTSTVNSELNEFCLCSLKEGGREKNPKAQIFSATDSINRSRLKPESSNDNELEQKENETYKIWLYHIKPAAFSMQFK